MTAVQSPAASNPTAKPPQVSVGRLPQNGPIFLATVLAGATTAAFYFAGPLGVLRETYLYGVFCQHGWVPYVISFLFCQALWVLLLKLPRISREGKAFSLFLLPEDAGQLITPAMSAKILDRIDRLAPWQKQLLLVRRIRTVLLRLEQLGGSETLDQQLRQRADADAFNVEASYALPRFIIWAIPVLGFVGTVLGISNGVSAFSSLIQSASDLEALRGSLKGVTYGLGQAFETTMVALVMSLILMMLLSLVQKREDILLARIDDYCTEHLLHRVEKKQDENARNLARMVQLLEQIQSDLAERRTDHAAANGRLAQGPGA